MDGYNSFMKRLTLIALLILLTGEPAAALDFLETKELAELGDPWYQTDMGLFYHHGQGVQKNYTEAARWYHLAADQGFAKAQSNLGVLYGEGKGVPQDYVVAANWFRKAAEQGNASAQHNLGLMYGRGQGVPQDYSEAYVWEALASAGGVKNAINNRDFCASKLSPEELKAAQRREWLWFQRIEQRKTRQ